MVKVGFGIDGLSDFWQDREQKKRAIPWLSQNNQRDVSLRYLLETLGTEWGRNLVADDVWLRIAEQELSSSKGMVIKDIRFPNEAEWVREKEGVLVHIIRDNYTSIDANINHPSNIPLSIHENDVMIHNDADLQTLERRVYDFINQVITKD